MQANTVHEHITCFTNKQPCILNLKTDFVIHSVSHIALQITSKYDRVTKKSVSLRKCIYICVYVLTQTRLFYDTHMCHVYTASLLKCLVQYTQNICECMHEFTASLYVTRMIPVYHFYSYQKKVIRPVVWSTLSDKNGVLVSP